MCFSFLVLKWNVFICEDYFKLSSWYCVLYISHKFGSAYVQYNIKAFWGEYWRLHINKIICIVVAVRTTLTALIEHQTISSISLWKEM